MDSLVKKPITIGSFSSSVVCLGYSESIERFTYRPPVVRDVGFCDIQTAAILLLFLRDFHWEFFYLKFLFSADVGG